jgi:hypothetical protein
MTTQGHAVQSACERNRKEQLLAALDGNPMPVPERRKPSTNERIEELEAICQLLARRLRKLEASR